MKEQKLILVEADIDYSGCYYEGDIPEPECTVKEVSLSEAVKAMVGESGYDWESILKDALPPKKDRGGAWKCGKYKQIEDALEKMGYFHSSRVKSFKPKGNKK